MWNAECCLVFFSPSGVFPWASYVYVDRCGLCHTWVMKKIPRLCVRRQFRSVVLKKRVLCRQSGWLTFLVVYSSIWCWQFRSVALKKTCIVQAVRVVDLPGCVFFYLMLAISKCCIEETCIVQAIGVVDLPGCVFFYLMLAISKCCVEETCIVQAIGVVDLPGCVFFYLMLAISKRCVEENVYCAGNRGGWPSCLCILLFDVGNFEALHWRKRVLCRHSGWLTFLVVYLSIWCWYVPALWMNWASAINTCKWLLALCGSLFELWSQIWCWVLRLIYH